MKKRYWLDAKKQAPHGWSHFRRGEELVVDLCFIIRTNSYELEELSIGDGFDPRWMNGTDVLQWITKVVDNSLWVPPTLTVHAPAGSLTATVLNMQISMINDRVLKREII